MESWSSGRALLGEIADAAYPGVGEWTWMCGYDFTTLVGRGKGLRAKAGLGSVRAIFAGAEHGRVPVARGIRDIHTLRYTVPCTPRRAPYTLDVA